LLESILSEAEDLRLFSSNLTNGNKKNKENTATKAKAMD